MLGARHSSGASWERGPLARIMIMSGPEARAPKKTRHWSGAPPAQDYLEGRRNAAER